MADERVERVIVTVDEQHLAEIQTVASALQSAGMQVEQVLSSTGIITGKVPLSGIPALKSIAGVVDVETDQEMQAI